MKLSWLFAAAIAMLYAGAANAAQIGSQAALCRAAPNPKAKIVVRLAPGTQISVIATKSSWSRVARKSGPSCWVASRLITGGSAAFSGTGVYSTTHKIPEAKSRTSYRAPTSLTTRSRTRPARATANPRTRSSFGSSSGSCPCGSGHICVGPRGGRFCITSGGNKRYGM